MQFMVRDRVRLTQDVDRYPDFIARKGNTGTVTKVEKGAGGDGLLVVQMDQPIDGAEGWNNEVHWHGDYLADVAADLELVEEV